MTIEAPDRGASLTRRLERYRASLGGTAPARAGTDRSAVPGPNRLAAELAERLATTLDGEVVASPAGLVVRCEAPSRPIAVDRDRLASLPGQPGPTAPLLCLDTETTGLATAAGTVAFLIGLGWWDGDRFRQVQLLLPDHGEEPALLAALAGHLPADGWLVTYNGRGFDWPLLETRYRLARQAAPDHAGHLDLLPIVRRLFRHRLEDARLRSVEEGLLGLERHGDVDGWEIPGRYLGFLRGGPVEPLVEVVRHNDQDVRSLARLLALLAGTYGGSEARRAAPAGDLAGLARAYARDGRLSEALACYDDARISEARGAPRPVAPVREPSVARRVPVTTDEPWWSPRVTPDFGGPRPSWTSAGRPERAAAFAVPWTTERIAMERAHLLRRMGHWEAAAEAWSQLLPGPGRTTVLAAIELAKIHEHRRRDPMGALRVASDGLRAAERRAAIGRPEPRLVEDLQRRITRLRRRVAPEAVRA